MEDKRSNETSLQSPPPATGTTPDYAAGLAATPTYAPQTPQPVLSSSSTICVTNYFKLIYQF